MSTQAIDTQEAARHDGEPIRAWVNRVLDLESKGPGDWNALMDFFRACDLPVGERVEVLAVFRERLGFQVSEIAATWF
jgi:hypothetical protein